MKRAIVLVSMIVMAVSGSAQAKTIKTHHLTFSGATPCAVAACTYWQPHQESPGTFAVLPEAAGTGAPGMESGSSDDAYEKQSAYACTKPGADGTFVDKVVTVPRGATYFRVDYLPDVDWDLYLCAKPKTGNAGRMIANEDYDDTTCADPVGVVACKSWVSSKVKAGQKIIVRAYNFSDPSDLKATAKFYS